ncbi:hypothetical protein KY330_04025 [Candidatus Woesearchaeota archaeon]|nr:hypothetical protein [Candidatus Woesearchaeota archaeon]
MSYYKRFKECEAEAEEQENPVEEIVLKENDPKLGEVIRRILDGEKISKISKLGSWDKEFGKLMERLGYQCTGGSSMGDFSVSNYRIADFISESIVVKLAEDNYHKIMEDILETKKIQACDVHMFMALVKQKPGADNDQVLYLEKVARAVSNRELNLPKGLISEIEEFAEKHLCAVPRYNPDYGGNDFDVNYADIDNDAKRRADILLDFLVNDIMRGKSSIDRDGYELVIQAANGYGRWYGGKRRALIHYYVLRELPEDFKIPRKWAEPMLRSGLECHDIPAAAIIDRAYRIESKRPKLII